MKMRLKIAGWLAAGTLMLASCSNIFYPQNAMTRIKQGMTPQEVTRLLGKPDYRRMNYGLEEWEYRSRFSPLDVDVTVIIVRFEDDRLVYMDSYLRSDREPQAAPPTPPAPPTVTVVPVSPAHASAVSNRQFRDFYKKVKSEPFKDDQMKLIRIGVEHKLFTCKQCADMMSLYVFDDDKMQVLRMFAPRLVDKENYDTIIREIDSLFKQDDAKKLLGVPIR